MKGIPDYEPMLAAYHRAFAPELEAMVDTLPIREAMHVLDMACGDGVYSPWLARRIGPSGRVVAVDLLPQYLEIARKAAIASGHGEGIEFVTAGIDTLPFEDQSFDLCWCAQSFYSLPDPVESVRHLARVTKPGGVVAALEADTLHHVLLPWPVELELAIRMAELEDLVENVARPRKFYVGRRLREVFRKAGLERIQVRTFAADRMSPLGPDERLHFSEYLKALEGRVSARLKGSFREAFQRRIDPDSKDYLLDDPDLVATTIDHLVSAVKPR